MDSTGRGGMVDSTGRGNDGFHRQWWNGECYNGTEEENEEESEWYVHGWVKMVGVC